MTIPIDQEWILSSPWICSELNHFEPLLQQYPEERQRPHTDFFFLVFNIHKSQASPFLVMVSSTYPLKALVNIVVDRFLINQNCAG